MTPITKKLLFWTPRTATILFALFISMFALDVFAEAHGFVETGIALLLHLIPTAIILAILIISWRREWIAGVAYIALGILYVITAWPDHRLDWWSAYLVIAGPLLLIGLLFLLNWFYRTELRRATGVQS